MLKKRLAEARLDEVPDPRDRRGRRWPLGTSLRSAVVGLVSGAQGLGDVERTTAESAALPACGHRHGHSVLAPPPVPAPAPAPAP